VLLLRPLHSYCVRAPYITGVYPLIIERRALVDQRSGVSGPPRKRSPTPAQAIWGNILYDQSGAIGGGGGGGGGFWGCWF
jgi:hypothetical protein